MTRDEYTVTQTAGRSHNGGGCGGCPTCVLWLHYFGPTMSRPCSVFVAFKHDYYGIDLRWRDEVVG